MTSLNRTPSYVLIVGDIVNPTNAFYLYMSHNQYSATTSTIIIR
jgi:hypothetical protein